MAPVHASLSPARRAWQRFRRHRLGYASLLAFLAMVVVSLFAEVLSNDKPLVARYEGQWVLPILQSLPETTFGGDFDTATDYLDPFIVERFAQPGNFALYPPNRYHYQTINYFATQPNPAPPSAQNWLGTDDRGRDVLARLLYGFRLSVWFALALTATGVLLGVLTGAVQGYFGGRTDLLFQRVIEIWSSMPELYLLIIFAAIFDPSAGLLLVLLSLFGWMGLSDYVRAEFLRNRQLEYVRAARALGLGHGPIIWRHVLPNSLTPVVTFLPFRMSAAILALTSLDFLGLGLPPDSPSLGELLAQGKNNLDAWWISLPTFGVLVSTLLLLTFMGDALRDALDPRKDTPPAGENTPQTELPPSTPAHAVDAPLPPETGPQAAELLNVRDLQVVFSGQRVVHGVSLRIRAGERLALVGESGSGKTVTALSLLRLLREAEVRGQAQFHGERGWVDLLQIDAARLRRIRGREIAVIFQEPMTALNPLFCVGEQIAEVVELHEGLSRSQAWARAVELLQRTGVPEPERRAHSYAHQLSGGQRQRVMIAMALACRPRLLLADEPTTALDVTLRQQILELLAEIQRADGMAVLLITHDLPLVRRFADRVVVMQQGRVVEEGEVAQVFASPRHPYTQMLLASRPVRNVPEDPASGAALVEAQGLRVAYSVARRGWRGWIGRDRYVAVQGADFSLPQGRTLGVMGESGSGKTTLALAVLGLLPCDGHLQVDGRHWQGGVRADRVLRAAVQAVFQDPFSSLSPRMSIEEIVGEGLTVHEPGLGMAQRRDRVLDALAEVGMGEAEFPGVLQRYPHEFSGGQRQRLAIARALIVRPKLIILDEPTSALDVSVQAQVLSLLQRLQRERGLAYLLISHDVSVIRAMAHEVLVMRDGQVLEQGPALQVLDAPAHPYTRALVAAAA